MNLHRAGVDQAAVGKVYARVRSVHLQHLSVMSAGARTAQEVRRGVASHGMVWGGIDRTLRCVGWYVPHVTVKVAVLWNGVARRGRDAIKLYGMNGVVWVWRGLVMRGTEYDATAVAWARLLQRNEPNTPLIA